MSPERLPIEDPKIRREEVPPPEVLLGAIKVAGEKIEAEEAIREGIEYIRRAGESARQQLLEIASGRAEALQPGRREASDRGLQMTPGLFERLRRFAGPAVGAGALAGIVGMVAPERVEAAPKPREIRQEKKQVVEEELTAEDRKLVKELERYREIASRFLGKSGLSLVDSLYLLKIGTARVGDKYGKDQQAKAFYAEELEQIISQIGHTALESFRFNPALNRERIKKIEAIAADAIMKFSERHKVLLSPKDRAMLMDLSWEVMRSTHGLSRDTERRNLQWRREFTVSGMAHKIEDQTALVRAGDNVELFNGGEIHTVWPYDPRILALMRRFYSRPGEKISAEQFVRKSKGLVKSGVPGAIVTASKAVSETPLPHF